MPDCRPCSNLADDSSRWLHKYPAHLTRTWRLASGESFSLRPVRHDDGALEEAFVRGLSLESRYQRMVSGGAQPRHAAGDAGADALVRDGVGDDRRLGP